MDWARRGRVTRRSVKRALTLLLTFGTAVILAAASPLPASASLLASDPPPPEKDRPAPDVMLGSKPWAVVLCQFSDTVGHQPHTVQWYQDFMTRPAPNHDGMWDYWHDISYGKLDLSGSKVITQPNGSWNTLPHTVSYYASLPHSSARFTLWHDCAASAGNVDYEPYYGIVAMLNAKRDSGAVATGPMPASFEGLQLGAWGAVVLDPAGAQDVSWAAHEMGHAFGLNHNYDTALKPCVNPKSPGEYCDPYDQMGYENSGNDFQTPDFGFSAPGMTAPNLAKLGFADLTTVDPTQGTKDVDLAPLETAPSAIQVPVGDAPNHYYTIEYRDPSLPYASGTAWGQKLAPAGVVIHEARTDGLFYLVDTGGGPTFGLCDSFVGANDIRILVVSTPGTYTGDDVVVRVGTVNDSVPDPSYCTSPVGVPPLNGVGGGGPISGSGCDNQFGFCYPTRPTCGQQSTGESCTPRIGRMQ